MSAVRKTWISPEQYLSIERAADRKSEYFNGEMFAMAGGSTRHAAIASNINGELHAQLKGRPCRAYGSDLRVLVNPTGLYTYPDVSVVCPPLVYLRGTNDTFLNPTVIFEVLSPSTEAYDRGDKLTHYRTIESLTDYVLVSQDEMRVEQFVRRPDGSWDRVETTCSEAVVELASIMCRIQMSDIYDKVDFEETEPESVLVMAS